jgi:hypothetical protein
MTTRFIILFWGMIFSLNSNSQNTLEKSPSPFRKTQIGLNVSPDFCYRMLRNHDKTQSTNDAIKAWDRLDMCKFGYTLGLNASKYFSKCFSIETGLQFSNKGFATKKLINSYMSIDSVTGLPEFIPGSGNMSISTKFYYNFYYLDIPIRTIFKFGKKKIQFISSIGLTTNILLKANQTMVDEYQDGRKEHQRMKIQYNFNSLNLSPNIGTGIEFKINNKSNLRIESMLRFGIRRINDGPMATHLWNLGLNISYNYKLKNN